MYEMRCCLVSLVLVALFGTSFSVSFKYDRDEEKENHPQFWHDWGRRTLEEAIKNRPIDKRAKNVIIMVGDGMSMTTITAARILKGQLKGNPGEEEILAFEKFPNIGLAKTYNVDHQIPDSAGTATAYLCGIKSNYGTIGVNGRVKRGDCLASFDNKAESIFAHAQRYRKSTGIVTTSRVTHATPAAAYAHTPERRWENDAKLKKDGADRYICTDIGDQLMDAVGSRLNVVMGGGRRELTPNTTSDIEYGDKFGRRTDGRNIIDEWVHEKRNRREVAEYIWNDKQLKELDTNKTDNVIGIFEYSHLKYKLDNKGAQDPTLANMAEKAIQILEKNEDGFVLLIEGALIDTAHHDNYAKIALYETLEFDKAVERVMNLVNDSETLLIVTADHSHSLIMNSYSTRGNYILGLSDYTDTGQEGGPNGNSDIDHKPYTTLMYGNGPGYTSPRENLTGVATDSRYFKIQTGIPNKWVSHDGTDVPIYARGALSHLIHSTHEQNYIYHAMMYAACLKEHETAPHCYDDEEDEEDPKIKVEIPISSTAVSFRTSMVFGALLFKIVINYL